MTDKNNQNLTERAEQGSHLPPVIMAQLGERLEQIREYRRNFEAIYSEGLVAYDKMIASYNQIISDIDKVLKICGETDENSEHNKSLESAVIGQIKRTLDSSLIMFSLHFGGGAALDRNDNYHFYTLYGPGKGEEIRIYQPSEDGTCQIEIRDGKYGGVKYQFRGLDSEFFRKIETTRKDFCNHQGK